MTNETDGVRQNKRTERLVHMLKAANEIGAKSGNEEVRELAHYLSRELTQMKMEAEDDGE